jgi:glycosyltransferase involved in cell wall biosynthesis
VGVLSRRKNIRIVIEALHELKNEGKIFRLHVMGGYKDDGYEGEITALVDRYQLKDQIVFHGWVKQEQIREIYSRCPIFILPSQQETLPVSIGEAMALGKVVIASDVGAIREMFSDRQSGFLFKKNDRDDLVRVLRAVYDNPDLAVIGQRAKQEAIEKFHPRLIAEKTIHFYQEVLQTLPSRANR